MMNKLYGLVAGFGLCGTLVGGMPAMAEEASAEPVPQASVPSQNPFGGKALDQKALAIHRGGTDAQVLNDMKLNGVVSDNRASNLTTGNNVIADGAFTGVNGVPLVVQNSGNNVLIQSATIVNVQVK